jgi:carboxyl-terminal processing protease
MRAFRVAAFVLLSLLMPAPASADGPAGIGALIVFRDGWVRIQRALPGSPAEHAGLKRGVAIVNVDGVDTRGLTLEEVGKLLRGEPGTKVTIRVASESDFSQQRTVELKRGARSASP